MTSTPAPSPARAAQPIGFVCENPNGPGLRRLYVDFYETRNLALAWQPVYLGAAPACAAASESPSVEPSRPVVPDAVIAAVTAYGDARADGDLVACGATMASCIFAIRDWAAALAASRAAVPQDASVEPPKPSAQGPAELWLQLHGEWHDLTTPVDYTDDSVTWCWHKIYESDVRYVRADLAASRLQAEVPAEPEASRPDILERLTYHALERDDLSLDDCLAYLASGWKRVRGRTERQLVMQILALLAAAPSAAPPALAGAQLSPGPEAALHCAVAAAPAVQGEVERGGLSREVLEAAAKALEEKAYPDGDLCVDADAREDADAIRAAMAKEAGSQE